MQTKLTSTSLLSTKEVQSIATRINFEEFANKRVVVTGASGLVGGYLTYALIKCTSFLGRHAPEVIAISKNGIFENLRSIMGSSNLTFMSLDLEKEHIDFGYEVLIHAASTASPTKKTTRESIFNVNCNLIRMLHINPRVVEKILFISTGEVYGARAPKNVSENFIGEINKMSYRADYPEAKLAGEELTLGLREVGIEGKVARLFHSFGPGLRKDDGRSFADFLWAASVGSQPILRSPGNQIRSFLYLEDTVVGLLSVLNSEITTPVNVGSEFEMSILEFATKVSLIAGLKGEVHFQPTVGETVYSPNNVVVPSNKLLRTTGWDQKIGLDSGIEQTLNWIRNMS